MMALLIFLFPLAYSPGPGNMLFAANAARFGPRACLPALAGYHVATWLTTWLLALGAARALDPASPVLSTIQLAGAGYVIWLALKMWRAAAPGEAAPRPMGFAGGAALLLLNPKAYVIIALMLSQFGPQIPPLMLSTLFTLNNLIAFGVWMTAGRGAMRLMARKEAARGLDRGFAVILGAVGLWMALR